AAVPRGRLRDRPALPLLLRAEPERQRPHPVADPGVDLHRGRRTDLHLRHAGLAGAREPAAATGRPDAREKARAARGRRAGPREGLAAGPPQSAKEDAKQKEKTFSLLGVLPWRLRRL